MERVVTDNRPHISEEEARRLWRRAAELHAAAELERARGRSLDRAGPRQLTLGDVTAAAEGAGIDPDYVRLTLAERRLADAEEIRRERWTARWTRRLVDDRDAIEVERLISAAPPRVLDALHAVAARPPFRLGFESMLGEDPLRDAVLVYRITEFEGPFGGAMDFADARVILTTVRADDDGTRLRFRLPLYRRGVNLLFSGVSGGLFGAGGWSAGGSIAGALGFAATGVFFLPAGIGAVTGGALGLAGYRTLYRTVVRKGEVAARTLLDAVAIEAGGGTSALGPPPPGPDASADG